MVVVIQSEAKNLEDIAQPYQWMHPRFFGQSPQQLVFVATLL